MIILDEKALFVDNFGNVHTKTQMRKLRSMKPTINQFQKRNTKPVLTEMRGLNPD